jgi:hypothetical protein
MISSMEWVLVDEEQEVDRWTVTFDSRFSAGGHPYWIEVPAGAFWLGGGGGGRYVWHDVVIPEDEADPIEMIYKRSDEV